MKSLTRTVTVVAKHAKSHPRLGCSLIHRSFITTARNYSFSTFSRARLLVPTTSVYRTYSTRDKSIESEPTSLNDPSRPDLFYHLVQTSPEAPPLFAVSFLSRPPPSPESSTIVGWLPADEGAGLNDFKENPKFRTILHEAIQSGLEEDVDEIQRNGAIQQHSGWMHIHDGRNVPALGRIGDPDDIIATVLVEEGQILSDSYQVMPAYRLATADGVTQLTPGLAEKLKTVLAERADKEDKDWVQEESVRTLTDFLL
ncbi:hypothetical protein V5O48_003440 [Marasmius crinis-equi]|uniref:Uncharacterized protein n=1 Tax=Marasmius crinis-equi TaxID=585013 RepID=A0ABR3FT76_9AGAR